MTTHPPTLSVPDATDRQNLADTAMAGVPRTARPDDDHDSWFVPTSAIPNRHTLPDPPTVNRWAQGWLVPALLAATGCATALTLVSWLVLAG